MEGTCDVSKRWRRGELLLGFYFRPRHPLPCSFTLDRSRSRSLPTAARHPKSWAWEPPTSCASTDTLRLLAARNAAGGPQLRAPCRRARGRCRSLNRSHGQHELCADENHGNGLTRGEYDNTGAKNSSKRRSRHGSKMVPIRAIGKGSMGRASCGAGVRGGGVRARGPGLGLEQG